MESSDGWLADRDRKFFYACGLELALGAAAIGLGFWLGPNPRERLPHVTDWRGLSQGLTIGAFVGAILACLMSLVDKLPIQELQKLSKKMARQVLEIMGDFSTPQLLAIALTAGVGEELLFRGWLMQSLTGDMQYCTLQELIVALSISSLLFGMMHPMGVLYVVLATFMGVALGLLYWLTNNLLAPIVAHWIYDAILLWILVREHRRAPK